MSTKSYLSLLSLLSSLSFHVDAQPLAVTQTQSQLKKIDAQINTLQHTLASAQNKHVVLHHELSNTEKEIGEGVRKLRSVQMKITTTEQHVKQLQDKLLTLNQQLVQQQELLASHLRARYQMGEYQPLKWVVNQDDPYQISRLLTYYQYFVRSRQQLIREIDSTKQGINDNKLMLEQELIKNKRLNERVAQHQQQLVEKKRYHTSLIDTLDHKIQTHQHSLEEAKKNKNQLSALLKSLSRQSVVNPSVPFMRMRKKLPFPVHSAQRSLQRMNQGVTFFADEGTVVTAVYPGKVVFSDWLKGYGLLLIIDHGQGFMTLYAHNQSLFKRKGQHVNQNEQIASVGHTGGLRQNGLYFEIRVKGKAVPPLGWLS